MKSTRDIVVVAIAVLAIIGSVFFAFRLLFPSNSSSGGKNQTPAGTDNTYVNKNIDNQTYNNLSKLNNYPKPSLDNIGKSDIFAGF